MLIEISLASTDDWTAAIRRDGLEIARRQLRRTTGPEIFPLPPATEAQCWAGQPQATLCEDGVGTELAAVFADISTRKAAPAVVRKFSRYLFDTLIGQSAWEEIMRGAGDPPSIDLALKWQRRDGAFSRLPWEMMCAGDVYLGGTKGVAIVRVVANSATPSLAPVSSPPHVLFVVGTDLQSATVRPGLEYLRMIQALEISGTRSAVRTTLLAEASPEQVRTVVGTIKPDVVHFICHGAVRRGVSRLELMSDDDSGQTTWLDGDAIHAMFELHVPRIVVLNACQSAVAPAGDDGSLNTPIAERLVTLGVGTAVGMAGRVSNQACRLFTRRFYESLLRRGDIAHATAEGRRGALIGGVTDPDAAFDWALPTIFINDQVNDTRIAVVVDQALTRWQSRAEPVKKRAFPPFCDRTPFFERLDVLLADAEVQEQMMESGFDTFVIEGETSDAGKFGLSFLLDELQIKAVRDGHLVCFLHERLLEDLILPQKLEHVLPFIGRGIEATCSQFELACPGCEWDVRDTTSGDTSCGFCRSVRQALAPANARPAIEQGKIVREALETLLEWARARRAPANPASMRLLVIVDDLHRMGPDVVRLFLDHFVAGMGLRVARSDIRVILGFSAAPAGTAEVSAGHKIIDWLGGTHSPARRRLGRFSDGDAELAYERVLLALHVDDQPRPLAIASKNRAAVMLAFAGSVGTIPSRLREVQTVALALLQLTDSGALKAFERADDEHVLQLARGSA